ncbi:hypothetical protein YQE_10411, partial [Dendroctonus ponderosae]
MIGITGGMVTCIGALSRKRQETLLFLAASILAVNIIAVLLTEWKLYFLDMPKLLSTYTNHMLIDCALFVVRISISTVIVVAFLDSQFAYCSAQSLPKRRRRIFKRANHSPDSVPDIEYIIPRDLESPVTAETPSDPPMSRPLAVWRKNSDPSGSEKTLSAVGSMGEIGSPLTEMVVPPDRSPSSLGKGARVLVRYPESQSTSGYSSPSHGPTPNWSTTSSINGSNHEPSKPVSYHIHNAKSTTVISLYSQPTAQSKSKSVTLVKITGEPDPLDNSRTIPETPIFSSSLISNINCSKSFPFVDTSSIPQPTSLPNIHSLQNTTSSLHLVDKPADSNNSGIWNVRSLLRKKKHHLVPRLCPELEGAIIKSESLAYLSEVELMARARRNEEIQRPKPPSKSSKPHQIYDAYAQSWVFDAENPGTSNGLSPSSGSPYLKILQNGTPKNPLARPNGLQHAPTVKEVTLLIDNPVVHVEEASDDNTSNSDRKLCHMKSFSRSASPVVLSASSSQLSLNNYNPAPANPPIYQYLEKLTEPEIYRSRLNTAVSSKSEEEESLQAPQTAPMRRVEAVSPQVVEPVRYASLMKELQKAIVSKKEPPSVTSPVSNSESQSQSKSSDTEFSKELEAALQLIQQIEQRVSQQLGVPRTDSESNC